MSKWAFVRVRLDTRCTLHQSVSPIPRSDGTESGAGVVNQRHP